MGFFDDVFKLAKTTADPTGQGYFGDNYVTDARRGPPPAPPGYSDPRNTFIQRPGSQGLGDLVDHLYNTEGARNYGGTFDQAYQNLNQPLHDNNRDDVYVAGTRSLASAFADRVLQQTGSLPTEDQIRQFVGQNLTPAFAQKFILGMAPDQINGIADDYIKGNPDALVNPGTQATAKSAEEQRILGLNNQLDQVYNAGKTKFLEDTNDTYGAQKEGLVNDLAGQGMLTQPNSRISLDKLEASKNKSVASGLNDLAGKRAQGSLDLSTTIEGLLQKNKDRAQNAYQFGKTFNAGQDDTYFNRGLQNRQLSIAQQLGQAQANSSKKDWTDYLNTGLNGAATAAKLYAL